MEIKGALEGSPMSEYQIYYERPKRIGTKKSYREFTSEDENSEVESMADDFKRRKLKVTKRKESPSYLALEKKQKQMTETLGWLGKNYELKEGMCLPRCVMYTHYLDFCKKNKLCPSGPATFGKIIRQKFPKLTTRRLGTRGQSKYHYYGIQVSESSPYFHSGYSKQGLTRFSSMKIKGEGQVSSKKFPLGNKTRTLLPEFPDAKKLSLPKGVSQEKVETFIMMYRTHCQRLLDTVISANFDGVQNFILHFWQGMPQHMKAVLECPLVVDVIAICDSILYKVLIDVLIPSSIQDLPDSLREEIREFASKVMDWLHESLSKVPAAVKDAKFKMARTFGNALTRQVSFVHLAQTARSVLLSYDSVSRMMNDLRRVNFTSIMSKVTFITDNKYLPGKITTFVKEFENLLSKQAPLEAYTEWLDGLVDRCILKQSNQEQATFEEKAADFLGMWSLFTSKILEDLTLKSASSFGVFHLIQTTFQEYILLIMENQKLLEMDRKLHLSLQMQTKQEFQDDGFPTSVASQAETPSKTDKKESHPIPVQTYKNISDNNNNMKSNRSHNSGREAIQKQVSQPSHSNTPAFVSRQIPESSPNMGSPVYAPSNAQPHLLNAPASERYPVRALPSFSYPVTSHAQDMTSYQPDFVNGVDKTVYASNTALNSPEFAANPWIQNDGQTLTVLNPVNYDTTIPVAGNNDLGYPRSGEFGLYAPDASQGAHPIGELANSISHRIDQYAYSYPSRKEEYAYSNTFSRYNNMYLDSVRGGTGQGFNPDMMNFAAFMQQPISMELENITSGHEQQVSRLQGVGTL